MKSKLSRSAAMRSLFVTAGKSSSVAREMPKAPPSLDPLEGTPVDEAGLAKLQALFSDPYSWYCQVLTSDFDTPERVNLKELFYNGIPNVDYTLQVEERAYLKNIWSEFEFRVNIQRLPACEMDAVLREFLGIRLQDAEGVGLEHLTYWAKSDCYYLPHGDTNVMQPLLHSAYMQKNGTIALYYSDGDFVCNAFAKPSKVAVLLPKDGGYQVMANGPVEGNGHSNVVAYQWDVAAKIAQSLRFDNLCILAG